MKQVKGRNMGCFALMLAFHACPLSLSFAQAWLKQVKGRNRGCSAFYLPGMLALRAGLAEAGERQKHKLLRLHAGASADHV